MLNTKRIMQLWWYIKYIHIMQVDIFHCSVVWYNMFKHLFLTISLWEESPGCSEHTSLPSANASSYKHCLSLFSFFFNVNWCQDEDLATLLFLSGYGNLKEEWMAPPFEEPKYTLLKLKQAVITRSVLYYFTVLPPPLMFLSHCHP